jgi:hypothetical protein
MLLFCLLSHFLLLFLTLMAKSYFLQTITSKGNIKSPTLSYFLLLDCFEIVRYYLNT